MRRSGITITIERFNLFEINRGICSPACRESGESRHGGQRSDLEEQEVIALLGLRLTPFHRRMLCLLLAHPLLSDEEVASVLGLQRRSGRCALSALRTLGCLEPLSTPAGRRWHLCGRGLRLMAAASHLHLRTIAVESNNEAEGEMARMGQRGELWLLQHIQHTAGVYGFFAMLAQAARQQPEQELCWWETGVACERRYQVREQWHNLRPDALAGSLYDTHNILICLQNLGKLCVEGGTRS